VEKPEDWRYSSAPFYASTRESGGGESAEPLLQIVPIWQWFYEEGPDGFV
jgi:hypothetical protein